MTHCETDSATGIGGPSMSEACATIRVCMSRTCSRALTTSRGGTSAHAYGAADDVPALLRELISAPPDEALSELWNNICHQGSVYSATPYAVPFLAGIAAAGAGTTMVLQLLGCIAASDDERGIQEPGSARASLARQIDVLTPLLADPDDEVRTTAAWALAQCRVPHRLVPALRERRLARTRQVIEGTALRRLVDLLVDPGGEADLRWLAFGHADRPS